MKSKLVVAAAVSLCLTGCASADDPAAVTRPVAAAQDGSVLTFEQAGQTYLKLSAASNAAREAWMRAPQPAAGNLAEHKKLAARAADATLAFATGLRAHRWPADAQPAVDALVKYLPKRAAAYQRAAKAGTVTAYLAAAAQIPVTTSLTGDVRVALGLPEGAVVEGAVPMVR